MGYETKLIIGEASALVHNELAYTKRPYKDGSGYHPKRRKGQFVYSGRKEHWFKLAATIDLCKLGDGQIHRLISAAAKRAKETKAETVHFYYADDGNTRVMEDRYGDGFWPVPVAEVLAAAKADDTEGYRRLRWAIATLESMKDDGMSVLFFGY